ncbi:MAG TPA: hypothetical protein VMV52_01510 [Candidatus Nanopelagicaceae bacterium]|nr:hypothetical protein [Candidatus Nanopelagicaceae bacterium]
MSARRQLALGLSILVGSGVLSGCSSHTRAVNDPVCVAFRVSASTYTNRITKARYAERMAEIAADGKLAVSPEADALKQAHAVWLKAKSQLEHFYAADKSGCVSN